MKFLFFLNFMAVSVQSVFAQRIGIGKTDVQIISLYSTGYNISSEYREDGGKTLYLSKTADKWTYYFRADSKYCYKSVYEPKSMDLALKVFEYYNKKFVKLSDNLWVMKYEHPLYHVIIDIVIKKFSIDNNVYFAYINPND